MARSTSARCASACTTCGSRRSATTPASCGPPIFVRSTTTMLCSWSDARMDGHSRVRGAFGATRRVIFAVSRTCRIATPDRPARRPLPGLQTRAHPRRPRPPRRAVHRLPGLRAHPRVGHPPLLRPRRRRPPRGGAAAPGLDEGRSPGRQGGHRRLGQGQPPHHADGRRHQLSRRVCRAAEPGRPRRSVRSPHQQNGLRSVGMTDGWEACEQGETDAEPPT